MEISSSPEEAGITMPLHPNYGHIHESSSSKLAPVSGSAAAENNNNMLHLRALSDQPNTTTAMTVVTAKKSASSPSSSSSSIGAVRYRECLKNHAAGIGGYAVDGCGEFMPSGEEGTIEALKCAACGCHRNFHRREVEGEPQQPCLYWGSIRSSEHHNHHHQYRKRLALPAPPILNPLLVPPNSAQMMALPSAAKNSPISENGEEINLNNNHITSLNGGLMQGGLQYYPPPPNAAGAAANSSFSFPHHRHYNHHHQSFMMMPTKAAKRFRTKFTMEQREKMYEFAEKIGWRIQKHDEAAVQQFCVEAGVKRHVLKVWMHNNKNTFGKKLMRFPEAFDPVPETGS